MIVASPVPAGVSTDQQVLWQQLASSVPDSAGGAIPVPPPSTLSTPPRNDTIQVTGPTPTYYTLIPLDTVSWWNIDRLWALYQTAPVGTVTVQVPAIPATSTGSTQVFLRVAGLNGLARLSPGNAARTSWAGQLPTGASMVAVVLQSINGQFYFGSQPLTTQNGLVITPTLAAVSEAEAVRLIRQL